MSAHNQQSGFATIVVVIIAAAVVIGGGIAAYMMTGGFGMDTASQSSNQQSQPTEQKQKSKSGSKPLKTRKLIAKALAGSAGVVRCEYWTSNSHAEIFIRNDNSFRMNGTATVESGTVRMHMVKSGDKFYLWTEGSSMAIVATNANADKKLNQLGPTFTPKELENLATDGVPETNIDCERASNVDPSIFKVPQNINFRDMPNINVPAQYRQ